jgi:hypothetical protein
MKNQVLAINKSQVQYQSEQKCVVEGEEQRLFLVIVHWQAADKGVLIVHLSEELVSLNRVQLYRIVNLGFIVSKLIACI